MTKVIDMKHLQMITMMCVICVTASCTTQKVAYRERFEEAKGYALYACIAHMNKFVDSTSVINKDYSGEYFVQLSSLSLDTNQFFLNTGIECIQFFLQGSKLRKCTPHDDYNKDCQHRQDDNEYRRQLRADDKCHHHRSD